MKTVINLNHQRMLRDMRRSRFLKIYRVEACGKTGEWVDTPVLTGEMVSSFIWAKQEDTSERHYTTFQPEPEEDTTHALVVHWT
jgi:hypothetical protein